MANILGFHFAARRTQSTPAGMSIIQPQAKDRGLFRPSTAFWRSRRAFSLDSPRRKKSQPCPQSSNEKEPQKQGPLQGMIENGCTSKYAVLQHVRNGENISSFEQEPSLDSELSEVNPVAKLKKFLNNVIDKLFDDKEYERTSGHTQEKVPADFVSVETSKDFSAKLSTLMSYFSSENREKYFNGEFLSLLAKKLFPNKDELQLNEFSQLSVDCKETGNELLPREKGDNVPRIPRMSQSSDVIICMKDKRPESRRSGGRVEKVNGVSLSVVARLVESLASSSDAESDSSSSSDYLTSDSSAAEDCDQVASSVVAWSNKTFHHTTVNCQDRPGNATAKTVTAEDSLSSSSSSLLSTSSSLSSSSSSSLKSQKKVKSKLYQRYYHVFCAGELVKLVQDGIPSAVLLKEYHDHGNWAAILEKPEA